MTADQNVSDTRRLRAVLATQRDLEHAQVDRWRTGLAIALYRGDLVAAQAIVAQARSEMTVATVFDEVLGPAMKDIGTLWERNQISIADEHLATSVAHRLLASRSFAGAHEALPSRGAALLATPEPERHTTSLLMADQVLRDAGYRTVLLGAGVPMSAFGEALERHRPTVVAVSSTMAFPAELAALVRAVGAARHRPLVLVGGASAHLLPGEFEARQLPGMQALDRVLSSEGSEPAQL